MDLNWKQIVAESQTFAEILEKAGLAKAGAQYKSLKRFLIKNNLDFSHIRQGLDANRGRKLLPKVIDPKLIFVEKSKYSRNTAKRYLLKLKIKPYQCTICKQLPIWLGKPLTLILDHKNGVRNDHRIDNLRFLCPNCNSQSETFGGRNILWPQRERKVVLAEIKSRCPSKQELQELVWKEPATLIAKRFGVTDKAVTKWCKKLELDKPGPGYWAKQRKLRQTRDGIGRWIPLARIVAGGDASQEQEC